MLAASSILVLLEFVLLWKARGEVKGLGGLVPPSRPRRHRLLYSHYHPTCITIVQVDQKNVQWCFKALFNFRGREVFWIQAWFLGDPVQKSFLWRSSPGGPGEPLYIFSQVPLFFSQAPLFFLRAPSYFSRAPFVFVMRPYCFFHEPLYIFFSRPFIFSQVPSFFFTSPFIARGVSQCPARPESHAQNTNNEQTMKEIIENFSFPDVFLNRNSDEDVDMMSEMPMVPLRITFNRIGLYRLAVHRNVFIVSKPIIRQTEITR